MSVAKFVSFGYNIRQFGSITFRTVKWRRNDYRGDDGLLSMVDGIVH